MSIMPFKNENQSWLGKQIESNPWGNKDNWIGAIPGMAGGAAALGGLSGLFGGGGMMGKGPSVQQTQRFSPQQQQMLNQILQTSGNRLNSNEFDFQPIEDLARSNFKSKTLPSIVERFTAMGDEKGSSALKGALGSAEIGLEQQLAAMKSQYNMQQQGFLQNLLGMGLTPQFENTMMPAKQGALQGGMNAVMQLLPLLAFL